MTDPTTPDPERFHDRPFRSLDETSRGPSCGGQTVAASAQAPYRDDAETIRARRRELEDELRSLGERERDLARAANDGPRAALPALARRALAYVALGATMGVAIATGLVVWSALDHVELDPHAERLHRRTVARAIRSARNLERASALRARDAIEASVRARAADVTRGSGSSLFGGPLTPANALGPCEEPSLHDAVPAELGALREDDPELLVTQLGETVWDVDRAALDAPSEWSSARIVPAHEGDRVVGLRLYGVRSTSLLARLGFENGDVVIAINRHPVTDAPGSVAEALLRDSRLVIALVRHGEPRTHTYLVRDAAG